jgi:UDP-N-acetyl-D-glucosamine dehydrogenase
MEDRGQNFEREIVRKVGSREAVVGVVGMGYVGLPLALRFCAEGFSVIGFDVDADKVAKLSDGLSYIEHIPSKDIHSFIKSGLLRATSRFDAISSLDAIIICVPTPLNKYREPDLSYVVSTVESCVPHMRKGQVLSLESTTYPGATEEELLPRLVKHGFTVGTDVFLVFSPEREDPGNKYFSTKTIPKVVGGQTKSCLEVGKVLYGAVIERIVPVSSTRTAEMTKLLENIHRAVNIGLVNEMKIVCDGMGIDIHEVIEAAATKPFGFVAYKPGPGWGGHCIPIDPFYLTWKAREFGLHTRFIELSGEINNSMPGWVMKKIAKAMNDRQLSIKGSKFLILGISYKKNIDDMRESPAVIIMEKLREDGAVLSYTDPHVPKFPRMREHSFSLESVPLDPEVVRSFDCCVVATDHDQFDWSMILEHARLIVDTRGVYTGNHANVVKA